VRHKKAVAVTAAATILLAAWFSPARPWLADLAGLQDVPAPQDGQMQIHFLSVGNADAVLIRTAQTAILIDAGENDDEQTVTDYLHRQGIDKLDLLIASHADADHIGGMDAVVERISTDTVWLAFDETDSADAKRLFHALDQHDVQPQTPPLFSVHSVGDLTIRVLGPAPVSDNTNDRSLVVRVSFGDVSCLLAGDISQAVEEWLISAGQDLSATVFKVIHHGSASSNSAALLQAVDPSIAVISCGRGNVHGHPDGDVLKRLLALDATVYRTDVAGTVVLTSDGKTAW